MRLYKVTLHENELHFIAEDKDHVITLLSNLIGTTDYFSLIKESIIEQIAGPIGNDDLNFYWGL